MEDTFQETPEITAVAVGRLLRDGKGIDVAVLDLRPLNTWTDAFIIATVTSNAHLDGLERQTKEYLCGQGFDLPRVSPKMPGCADEWRLIDAGTVVIHLMTARARAFYDLERLWSDGPRLSLD